MANSLKYNVIGDWSGKAAEALTAYRGVVIDFAASPNTVAYPAVTGDRCDGVVLVNAALGEQVQVITDGIVPVKVTTAGTIVKGDKLMVDTNGGFIEATVGEVAIAEALQAATGNGDVILAKLIAPVTV